MRHPGWIPCLVFAVPGKQKFFIRQRLCNWRHIAEFSIEEIYHCRQFWAALSLNHISFVRMLNKKNWLGVSAKWLWNRKEKKIGNYSFIPFHLQMAWEQVELLPKCCTVIVKTPPNDFHKCFLLCNFLVTKSLWIFDIGNSHFKPFWLDTQIAGTDLLPGQTSDSCCKGSDDTAPAITSHSASSPAGPGGSLHHPLCFSSQHLSAFSQLAWPPTRCQNPERPVEHMVTLPITLTTIVTTKAALFPEVPHLLLVSCISMWAPWGRGCAHSACAAPALPAHACNIQMHGQ